MFNFAGIKEMLFPNPLPPLEFHDYHGTYGAMTYPKEGVAQPCLKPGASGEAVKLLQNQLAKIGRIGQNATKLGQLYNSTSCAGPAWPYAELEDGKSVAERCKDPAQCTCFKAPEKHGYYGPATAKAVEAYQEDTKLLVDGEAGPNTWKALTGTKGKPCGSSRPSSSSSRRPSSSTYTPTKKAENNTFGNILKYGGFALALGLGVFFIYKGFTAGNKSNPKKKKTLFSNPKKSSARRLKKLRRNRTGGKSSKLRGRRRRGPRIQNRRRSNSLKLRRNR